MDLSVFSPVCLPYNKIGHKVKEGHVYGEICFMIITVIFQGWGDTGTTDATKKLQKAIIPIVPSSDCNDNVDVADLIVCAGGSGKGPCKVDIIKTS